MFKIQINNMKKIIIISGMLTSLDDSVGSIIKSLDNNGMLENSIVLFASDNGAPADDPVWGYGNSGSNWPLRGVCYNYNIITMKQKKTQSYFKHTIKYQN